MNQTVHTPAPPELRKLHLTVYGGFRASIGAVELNVTQKKARALLALLVMEAPFRATRAKLRGLLWSDSDEVAAQVSLRNAIWHLKAVLEEHGFDGLRSDRNEVWLEPGSFDTDLAADMRALSAGRCPVGLLPSHGFPVRIFAAVAATDLFETRLEAYRKTMATQAAALCKAALAASGSAPDVPLLELLMELEPLNEGHCRRLLSVLIAQGRKADALAQYQKLWNLLDEEFGEEPSPETQALVVALKQMPERDSGVDGGKPTIIVRLIPALGPPATRTRLDHLRGLALQVLARFREWRVVDEAYCDDLRSMTARFGGPTYALSLLANPQSGASPRGQVTLTDVQGGQVLWSEPVLLASGGRAESLDVAVRKLAMALNLHLSGPVRPPDQHADLATDLHYDQWLRAQQLMRQFTHEGWRSAEEMLDRIIAADPQFVRALSSRASLETMRHIAFPGVFSTAELHHKALAWASAATVADPLDSRAQLSLGWACAMSRQFERAELAYELAFQHNENDPWTIVSSSVGFAFCNQIGRARTLLDYLENLDLGLEPVHWSYIAATAFLSGDDQTCIEMSERARGISCDVDAWHAAALAHTGRREEARAMAQRFLASARDGWSGSREPTEPEITSWLLSCFPIRNKEVWARLQSGLQMAGLRLPGQ